MKDFLQQKMQGTPTEFFRYFLASGLALLLDIGLLVGLTELAGVQYLVSATCGFVAGVVLNYFLSIHWVFRNRSVPNQAHEFFIFGSIGVIGLILNNLLLWGFTEGVGLYYVFSKMAATGFVFLWNFTARKLSLFRSHA